MDFHKLFFALVVGKIFQDTRTSKVYFFHPPMLVTDFAQVVVGDRNTNMGSPLLDCYILEDTHNLYIRIREENYLINRIIIPYNTSVPAEVYLTNPVGNEVHLRQAQD